MGQLKFQKVLEDKMFKSQISQMQVIEYYNLLIGYNITYLFCHFMFFLRKIAIMLVGAFLFVLFFYRKTNNKMNKIQNNVMYKSKHESQNMKKKKRKKKIVIVLADDQIHFCKLLHSRKEFLGNCRDNFAKTVSAKVQCSFLFTIDESKGAHSFAVNRAWGTDLQRKRLFISVGYRNKMVIYEWKGNDAADIKHANPMECIRLYNKYNVPEKPRCLIFAGFFCVCLCAFFYFFLFDLCKFCENP